MVNGDGPSTAASSNNGTPSTDNILLISSMDQTRDESFQATFEELKASTSKAVRPEMIDRILDGGEYPDFMSLLRPESLCLPSVKLIFLQPFQ